MNDHFEQFVRDAETADHISDFELAQRFLDEICKYWAMRYIQDQQLERGPLTYYEVAQLNIVKYGELSQYCVARGLGSGYVMSVQINAIIVTETSK